MPFNPFSDDLPSLVPGLYVVSTPIGNLQDITLRALQVLHGAHLIAAEDTRHTAKLLSRYEIHTPLHSCHAHNESRRTDEILDMIRAGKAVALVSDAGTPSVSDPGYRLVCAAIAEGLPVFPVPGVSAAITALSVSGLPTDAFVFIGFPPRKSGARQDLLDELAAESRTLIFYESPRRITDLLEAVKSRLGERPAVLAREMTKIHEEFLRGTLSDIAATLSERPEIRGECTLLVAGASSAASPEEVEEDLDAAIEEALNRSDTRIADLSRTLSRQFGRPRKVVYQRALDIQALRQKGEKMP
ncbi:16S rRNA (cytidine(1402)-2'-O)-methyltransferase [Desulfosarcina sp. OttesenSCG-928-A07]|nr:16S rRNA (cytidine(1402)-2'-O)-methyltransferase [Desulfosarcina sp. OttesenSCG-928-G17]MDL2329353.1 16S rRNA (cytidine(1402)-2'-O)-methyltransferase [Desulfosarcina sp. OttesenSCG-928-A07]